MAEQSTNPDLASFLVTGADGQSWRAQNTESWDPVSFYNWYSDCRRLLLSRDEVTWLEKHTVPDREVDVFVNMSCGTQLIPHVTLEIVDILNALGVDFRAGTGAQYCCGKPFLTNERPDDGHRVTATSRGRFQAWGASTAVHVCPSCQIVQTHHAEQIEDTSLRNVHFTEFLLNRLEELGDRVPWRKTLDRDVVVHGHDVTTVHTTARETTARILGRVPGVQVMGFTDPPPQGNPCATEAPGAPSVLAEVSDAERREVTRELAAMAASKGADMIAVDAHYCHREWQKFGSDDLPVRHYLSIVAEALDCSHPDRYHEYWHLRDPERVLRLSRPYWTSWGIDEQTARVIAYKNFKPHFAGYSNPKCGCGGDPRKCTTVQPALSTSGD
ncbi:MAG TPA: (Fe-S)-binding protein [Jatrophihabitans sp.]|nr:(Fe-S)-binding protein [Jatrophihabitans sp.]